MGSLLSTSKEIKIERKTNPENNSSTIYTPILTLEKSLIEGNFHRAESMSNILWTYPRLLVNFYESEDKADLVRIVYNVAHAKLPVGQGSFIKIKEFVFSIKTLFPETYEYAVRYAIAKNDIETAKYLISIEADPLVPINLWPKKISLHDEKVVNIKLSEFTEKFQDEILEMKVLGLDSFENTL